MKLSVMTLPLLPAPNIPGLEQASNPEKAPGLSELYGEIKKAGASYLDISSMDFQFGGGAAVLSALAEHEMTCSCYLAFIEAPGATAEDDAKAVQAGKAAVEQTLRLGAKVMMFVPAGNQAAIQTMTRQELADAFARVLSPVVEYAKEKGVTVVIEDAPHRKFPMCSEAELRYLLEAVPGLKLVYDSGNMLFAGEDPVEYYDHLAAYAVHAHAKDIAKGENDALCECSHGQGIVDFSMLFSHMRGNGFSGFIAIELAPDFAAKESVTDRVRKSLTYLNSILMEVSK